MVPLAKIAFDYVTINLNANDKTFSDSFNNIHAISLELEVGEDEHNSGWIYEADWKHLKSLSVQDFDEVITGDKPWNFTSIQFRGNFLDKKWSQTLPELVSVSIKLTKIPFPYCTLAALLFGSPNLVDLNVHLYNQHSDIQNFDKVDFRSQLKKNLKLKNLTLLKRYAGIGKFLTIKISSAEVNLFADILNFCYKFLFVFQSGMIP